jgi:hypothetical protein
MRRSPVSRNDSTLKVVSSTGHLLPLVVADEIIQDLAP